MSISAVSVLIIVALLAVVAMLSGRRLIGYAIVALFGALISNTGGKPGQVMDTVAGWTLGAPGWIASLFT